MTTLDRYNAAVNRYLAKRNDKITKGDALKITIEVEPTVDAMPLVVALSTIESICDELLISGDVNVSASDRLSDIKQLTYQRHKYYSRAQKNP